MPVVIASPLHSAWSGKGKASGVPVDQRIGVAYRFRNGKLWRMRSYLDPAEALEAVGLSE